MQHAGVDIIEIDRIKSIRERWGMKFLKRVFTSQELALCQQRVESLAARFAGKEAVFKVLGACSNGIGWHDIEILAAENGKPTINLTGSALRASQELRIAALDLSLSHSEKYAVAFAVGTADADVS